MKVGNMKTVVETDWIYHEDEDEFIIVGYPFEDGVIIMYDAWELVEKPECEAWTSQKFAEHTDREPGSYLVFGKDRASTSRVPKIVTRNPRMRIRPCQPQHSVLPDPPSDLAALYEVEKGSNQKPSNGGFIEHEKLAEDTKCLGPAQVVIIKHVSGGVEVSWENNNSSGSQMAGLLTQYTAPSNGCSYPSASSSSQPPIRAHLIPARTSTVPPNTGSLQILIIVFDSCGIPSVTDGFTENLWQTLVWPLAEDSPALYHAFRALRAFHNGRDIPESGKEKEKKLERRMYHIRKSLEYLTNGIGTMRIDAALATTLILAFSDTSTGIQHLRCSEVLICQAISLQQRSVLRSVDLARLQFLYNILAYMRGRMQHFSHF